jgi:two-component system sensor histidine kinase KdpD
VRELLDNGINVYITLNLQHIESQNDSLDGLSCTTCTNVVPDEVFENADEIVLVDATSDMLLGRLARGKINIPENYRENLPGYFSRANIISRREATLRLISNKVTNIWNATSEHRPVDEPESPKRQLMVLIGADHNAENLIRVGKNIAYSLGMTLYVLHVEGLRELESGEITRLKQNIDQAHRLGAKVLVSAGNDLIETILDVARRERITHIVRGRSRRMGLLAHLFGKGDLAGRLLRKSNEFLVCVKEMPSPADSSDTRKKKRPKIKPRYGASYLLNYLWAFLSVAGSVWLSQWIFNDISHNTIWFVQLFVLLVLVMYVNFGAAVFASILSTIAWVWLIISPQFSFAMENLDLVLSVIALPAIALVGAAVTSMLRRQRREARRQSKRCMALFDLTEKISAAKSIEQISAIACDEIRKYFDIRVYLCFTDENGNLTYDAPSEIPENFSERDREIAEWTLTHGETKTGKNSDSFADESEYAFYVLQGLESKQGVAIVRLGKKLDVSGSLEFLWNLFLTQVSNAIERYNLFERNRYITLMSESDRLYETIFNSLSHELRNPITNIMGASDIMLSEEYPPELHKELTSQIYVASVRLDNLIDNLLSTSRIESRKIQPDLDWCDINDLINDVLNNLSEELKPFKVEVSVPESMPLVEMDFGLMEQVLHNLLYNSSKYTNPGTEIELKVFFDDKNVVIQEMDRGPGFPPDVIDNVFDKFYRGKRKGSGGLGLGLTIARGFVKAHNGTITVKNREGGGAVFTITLPNTQRPIPQLINNVQ